MLARFFSESIKIYTERVWLFFPVFVSVTRVLKRIQREAIGQTVFKHRTRAGFSQESLAEKANVHPNYIGRIERGECSASLEVFLRIAKALNVRPYKLFLKLQ